jgi:hypothetical protein
VKGIFFEDPFLIVWQEIVHPVGRPRQAKASKGVESPGKRFGLRIPKGARGS